LASSSRKGVMRLPSITPARLLTFLFDARTARKAKANRRRRAG